MDSMHDTPLDKISHEELKQLVGQKYGKVATCPLDQHGFPTGRPFALAVGYPKGKLDTLPDSLVESFAGVNYPLSFQEMKPGNVVLDIGCGAGMDLYFASQKVGEHGKVYGVDISEEMVKKARNNMQNLNLTNVEVKLAHSDSLPLDDGFVDVITSNGIYNLSPDKKAVLKEAYRVLKSKGVICFSEIVLKQELEQEIRKSVKDWFRCIGGALTQDKFVALMEDVGFENVKVLSTCRNARCGHEYAVVAIIKAHKR
ncbi:methyltransferase domain-containing protein [Candidatus Woesearchaeota archaeon]|nr:methyltransferase domain-containing protein [Candidatus Woesearchaeota archaeon]